MSFDRKALCTWLGAHLASFYSYFLPFLFPFLLFAVANIPFFFSLLDFHFEELMLVPKGIINLFLIPFKGNWKVAWIFSIKFDYFLEPLSLPPPNVVMPQVYVRFCVFFIVILFRMRGKKVRSFSFWHAIDPKHTLLISAKSVLRQCRPKINITTAGEAICSGCVPHLLDSMCVCVLFILDMATNTL